MEEVTAQELLDIYAAGYFPMAENKDDPALYWFQPEERGVLPIDGFNVPHGMRRLLAEHDFTLRVDADYEGTMRACAELNKDRTETWINERIVGLYCELHALGHAHSVETWRDGKLVGGLYGVSIGGAFFGESMFSRESGASKVALVQLVALLKEAGYSLLDTQYVNDHLKQFGVQEVAHDDYMVRLESALSDSCNPSKHFSKVAERSGLLSSGNVSVK